MTEAKGEKMEEENLALDTDFLMQCLAEGRTADEVQELIDYANDMSTWLDGKETQ